MTINWTSATPASSATAMRLSSRVTRSVARADMGFVEGVGYWRPSGRNQSLHLKAALGRYATAGFPWDCGRFE